MPLYNAGYMSFDRYEIIVANLRNTPDIEVEFPEIQRINGDRVRLDFVCPANQEIRIRNIIRGINIVLPNDDDNDNNNDDDDNDDDNDNRYVNDNNNNVM